MEIFLARFFTKMPISVHGYIPLQVLEVQTAFFWDFDLFIKANHFVEANGIVRTMGTSEHHLLDLVNKI